MNIDIEKEKQEAINQLRRWEGILMYLNNKEATEKEQAKKPEVKK